MGLLLALLMVLALVRQLVSTAASGVVVVVEEPPQQHQLRVQSYRQTLLPSLQQWLPWPRSQAACRE